MTTRPNILIFNPDEWRGDVLGHVGNHAAHTPNLDKLVKEDAVSFRQAFCQNPVCTPSRCSFMTGWYPHTRGHRTMHHMLHYKKDEPNLLKILKDEGYYVWWGGKNDLVPRQYGFRKHCNKKHNGILRLAKKLPAVINQEKKFDHHWRGNSKGDNYYSFYVGKLKTKADQPFVHHDLGNILGAVDFIQKYKKKKPFCIYLPLSFPHPQYGVDDPWFSITDREKIPERIKAPIDWSDKPAILKGIYEKQNLQGWNEARWNELRGTYYGMCALVDDYFGQIITALKTSNQYDNTAIFFFSDHGDFAGDYGLVEKTQNTFQDCLSRVPFIVKPPKNYAIQPRVSDSLVELVDFSATVYQMTRIESKYTSFGKSLLPLFEKDDPSFRTAVFCEGGRLMGETQAMEKESRGYDNPENLYWPRLRLQASDEAPYHGKGVMCRTSTHKYIRRLYEMDEFYDLEQDPQELQNEINNPAYNEIIVELKEKMLSWYQATCDVVPMQTDLR